MNVILIRHGDVIPQIIDGVSVVYDGTVPLSPRGIAQLENLGKVFAAQTVKIDGLYVSPYERAQQSANALERFAPARYRTTLEDLRDIDPYSWLHEPLADYHAIGGDIYGNPKPGRAQETLEEHNLQAYRALLTMYEDAAAHGYDTIAAITHGDRFSAMKWMIRHGFPPNTYAEMKAEFYPEKGEALGLMLDHTLRTKDNGHLWKPDEIGSRKEKYK